MNSGYLFGKECDNEDFIVDSAKTFSIALNATKVTSESLHPRMVRSEKFRPNVAQVSKTTSSVSTISSYNEKNTSTELLKELNVRDKRLPFLPDHFNLTERLSITSNYVSDIFENATKFLDKPGAIMVTASSDSRTQTVKSSNGIQPLIVTPSTRNSSILTCTCRTHHLFEFCHHTLALSSDNNIIFEYIPEVVKKLELKKKARKPMVSITNVLNSSLTISQKEKNKNEIKKAVSSKTHIIQPEDENSGRKPTSQSTQPLITCH